MGRSVNLLLSCAIGFLLVSLTLFPSMYPNDDREDLYIFGMFGQSNAAYHYEDVDLVNRSVDPVPAGSAFYFGNGYRPVLYTDGDDPKGCRINDMCPNGTWRIGNIEASLAKTIVDSGRKVLIVNFGISGFVISELMPGSAGWVWEKAVLDTALSMVDKARYRPVMSGVVCVHGESDSNTDVDEYKRDLVTTMGALYGYGFDCTLMVYVRPTLGDRSLTAQKQLVDECRSFILACSSTLGFSVEDGRMRDDDLHYSQLGDIEIGISCAYAWLNSDFVK